MMPGPFGTRQRAAQAEDDCALVVAQNLDGVEQIENDDGNQDKQRNRQFGHGLSSLSSGLYSCGAQTSCYTPCGCRGALGASAGSTRSRYCSCPTTRSGAPAATGSLATARQISPSTSTWPSGVKRLHGRGRAAHQGVGAQPRLHCVARAPPAAPGRR